MADADFAALIQPVAEALWGVPSSKTKSGLRWGSNGSKSVDLDKGAWYDHEQHEGGNVVELVMHEIGGTKADAIVWLEREGFIAEREEAAHGQTQPRPTHGAPKAQSRSAATPESQQTHPNAPDDQPKVKGEPFEVAHYDYADADGAFQYRVTRYHFRLPDGSVQIDPKTGNPKKTFKQKHRAADGTVQWGLGDKQPCLYRWQAIERAAERGEIIFVCEGEKDVETLVGLGLEATTNSGGAQNWQEAFLPSFKMAEVVILIDNDEAGRERGKVISGSLQGIAHSVRVIDISRYWAGAGPKADVTDWIEKGEGSKEKLLGIATGQIKPLPPKSVFGAKTSRKIAQALVTYDWLVKHLIERNGILIIAGESQDGKSFLVMDMGMKIARGIDYAGHKVKQGAVIHMAVEDGKGTELRHKGYRKANGISPDVDLPYVIMDPFANGGTGFSLMSDEQVDKFIAECLEWKDYYGSLEFIIIDTLAMATEGMDENSSGEASKVLGRVNRIRERTGATVCIVHHMNAGGTKVRGSTAIVANVPNVIELKQMMTIPQNRKDEPRPILDGDKRPIRRARLSKNKNGAANISWAIVLEEVELDERDEDGEPFKTMICARPTKRDRDSEPKGKINSEDQRLVLEALNDALADHGADMPSGVRVGPQIKRCVAQKDFVAYVRQRMQFKALEDEPEARMAELTALLKRTTTSLLNAGYIGRDNDKKIIWSLGKDRRVEHFSPPMDQPEPPPALPDDVRRELAEASDEPPF